MKIIMIMINLITIIRNDNSKNGCNHDYDNNDCNWDALTESTS